MPLSEVEDSMPFQPFQTVQSRDDEPHEYKEQLASSMDEDSDDLLSANGLESVAESENNIRHHLASPAIDTSHSDEQLLSVTDKSHLSARPNKYNGPPSTWRSWTAAERGLAASLDQLSAKDLSVHLYNANALKREARRISAQNKQSTDIDVGGEEWIPPKKWTAWPLAPDVVPRENDHPGWAEKTFSRRDENHRRSKTQISVLKDLLLAQVLKKAKERRVHRRESELDSEHGAQPANQSESSIISGEESELEPVTMLDDEVAGDLLQPAIHHILTKLDHLLMGLHHAQNAYKANDGFTFESQIKSDDDESGQSERHKRERSSSRPKKNRMPPLDPSPFSGPTPTASADNESTMKLTRSRERSRSTARKTRPVQMRNARCGLRDWSDVIGIASMTGWDSKLVQKAAFRCSKLFEEGITLRTLNEHGDDSHELVILPDTPHPDSESSVYKLAQTHFSDARRFQIDGAVWELYCPITTCPRAIRAFSNSTALKRHLRQVHQGLVEQSDQKMIGGVHVDGFLQPIPVVERWIREENRRQHTGRANHLDQTVNAA